jgi:hypothetical protein
MSIRRILFKDATSVTPTLLNFIVMEWKRLQIFATQKLYFIFYFIFLTCSSKITGGWKRFSFTLIFKLIVNSITARNQISPSIHQINKFLVSWGKFQSGISEVCSKSLGKLGKLIKLCIKKGFKHAHSIKNPEGYFQFLNAKFYKNNIWTRRHTP